MSRENQKQAPERQELLARDLMLSASETKSMAEPEDFRNLDLLNLKLGLNVS